MWSKGAVVIVKHGDPELAETLENLAIKRASDQELEELRRENAILKRENTLLRMRNAKELSAKIEQDEYYYGTNPVYPKWFTPFREFGALLAYWGSLFLAWVDRMHNGGGA